jgi:hypothetical protein
MRLPSSLDEPPIRGSLVEIVVDDIDSWSGWPVEPVIAVTGIGVCALKTGRTKRESCPSTSDRSPLNRSIPVLV